MTNHHGEIDTTARENFGSEPFVSRMLRTAALGVLSRSSGRIPVESEVFEIPLGLTVLVGGIPDDGSNRVVGIENANRWSA
jgi:hypothetical protein